MFRFFSKTQKTIRLDKTKCYSREMYTDYKENAADNKKQN